MFGRRNRENRQQAQREVGRRALFEELAKRPRNICPFLGLATNHTEYHDGVTREHRCYASGEAAELSAQQQERVCLTRGYGSCPRYLRGVLVIPTDELEALRRPLPPARPPAPPVAPPPAATASGGGGMRLPLGIGLVLLLAAVGTVGTILLTRSPVAVEPTPSAQPSASAQASASVEASASPSTGSQTPSPETPKPDPTPLPGDTFLGYEVTVLEGQNTLFEVDAAGTVVSERSATYARFSKAPVDRIAAPNDLLHWRTSAGFFTGLSYIHDRSGPFLIRKVYEGSDGTKRYLILPDSET